MSSTKLKLRPIKKDLESLKDKDQTQAPVVSKNISVTKKVINVPTVATHDVFDKHLNKKQTVRIHRERTDIETPSKLHDGHNGNDGNDGHNNNDGHVENDGIPSITAVSIIPNEVAHDTDAEYGLNPQLQTLLELISDEERVIIARDNNDVNNRLDRIEQTLDSFIATWRTVLDSHTSSVTSKMDDLIDKTNNRAVTFLEQPTSTAHPTVLVPVVPVVPPVTNINKPKGYLADLITDYNNDTGSQLGSKFNAYFPVIYVFNLTKKGLPLTKYLNGLGLNAIMIDPDLPVNIEKYHTLLQYYMDSLDHAVEKKYSRALFIHDNVLPHRDFLKLAGMTIDAIQGTNWTMLQTTYPDPNVKLWNKELDWEFYSSTNHDINNGDPLTQSQANDHWQKIGFRQGRTGKFSVSSIDKTYVNAFAIQECDYEKLKKQLHIAANTKKPMQFLSYGATIVGVQPNLFIPKMPQPRSYAMNHWFPLCYSQV